MDLIHIGKKEFAKIPYKSTYIDILRRHIKDNHLIPL